MMGVVKSLCEKFTGTYNTICVDRFYTLIDLLRELFDMLFFAMVMGMKNCTPKGLKTTKRSPE